MRNPVPALKGVYAPHAAARTPTLPRLRHAATAIAVICATVIVCGFCAEVALRFTTIRPRRWGWVGQNPNRPSSNFQPDRYTGWRLWPYRSIVWAGGKTYRSNSQGFRADSEFASSDPRFKIAFVGDSYTFGYGVSYQETFPALVEKDSNSRIASWNFGMPAFGVDQIWLSARHQALPLGPQLLVVGLVDIDFPRSQVSYRLAEGFNKPVFQLEGGRLVERTVEPPPNPVWRFFDKYSRLWGAEEIAMRWVGTRFPIGGFWSLNRAFIDALRDDCRRVGVPVLFIYIPIDTFHPFPALAAYMRRTGANYIDLTEVRPSPPGSTYLYLPADGHFSPAGHRYTANLVEQWLQTHPGVAPATTASGPANYRR
jgi:hypothetical protein